MKKLIVLPLLVFLVYCSSPEQKKITEDELLLPMHFVGTQLVKKEDRILTIYMYSLKNNLPYTIWPEVYNNDLLPKDIKWLREYNPVFRRPDKPGFYFNTDANGLPDGSIRDSLALKPGDSLLFSNGGGAGISYDSICFEVKLWREQKLPHDTLIEKRLVLAGDKTFKDVKGGWPGDRDKTKP